MNPKLDELIASAKKLKPNDQLRLALMAEVAAAWHMGKHNVPMDRVQDFTANVAATYFAIIARNVLTDVMNITMDTDEDPALVILMMATEYQDKIPGMRNILNNIRSAIISEFKKD